MSTRTLNEKKFGNWDALAGGGRRYWLDVQGRLGWRARYLKEVDAQETTLMFWREIYDDEGNLSRSTKSIRWIEATRKCKIGPC